ncbi:solute carrier family 35 member G1-like [Styela clava]
MTSFVGISCALLSALLYATMLIFVEMIDLHPVQINLTRCVVQFLTILPFIQYKHDEIDITGPTGLKSLLVVRAFIGSSGMMFLYLAVDKLSAGNAITISYLRIVMVPFLSRIWLKESLSVYEIIFAFVALTGVIFIVRPPFLFSVSYEDETNLSGVIFALLSALCMAVATIAIRKLGRETHPALHIIYYSFSGAVTCLVILTAGGEFKYPCWNDLPMLFSFGIIANLGQFLITIALQRERAGIVVVLRSIQIVFVYIMQVTLLGDVPSYLSLIGASLIFSTSIAIGVRKVMDGRKRVTKT